MGFPFFSTSMSSNNEKTNINNNAPAALAAGSKENTVSMTPHSERGAG
jgi:hypothetical protein